jgi:hypothetical protein
MSTCDLAERCRSSGRIVIAPDSSVATCASGPAEEVASYQSLIVPISETGARFVLNAYLLGYGLFGNQTSRKYRPKGIFLKANLPLGLDTNRDERPNVLLYNVSLIPPTGRVPQVCPA